MERLPNPAAAHGSHVGFGVQSTKVFLNGVWLGIHREPQNLVSTLRRMRRSVSLASCALPGQGHCT